MIIFLVSDLYISVARECYVSLKLALTSLKTSYLAYVLILNSNTVAVFHSENDGSYKYFDHILDNPHCNRTREKLKVFDVSTAGSPCMILARLLLC